MDQTAFIEYENLCNAVFGNTGNGNTPQAREALERISLSPDFVEKSEVIFTNSRNNYALMNAGTSLTRLLTDYWTSYDNDQKLRIRDFILKYLINQGQNLPSYLVSCLSKLVCRITSLSWLSDQRHRNILTQMLEYTKSREHCILALQILEELVGEINPNNHSKLSESKTATEFRESNLQNIIGLAFNLLNDTYNSDDSTIGNPELRMQLFDHSLTLLLACLSFDCKSSHYDYSNDNLPCMMLPEGWLSSLITESNITLLYSIYQRCTAPVSTHVLEVLLWIWCNPHLDSYLFSSDGKAYLQFLNGIVMIAEQQQGLDEVENVHVFCQLLNRIMSVMSIRRYISNTLIPLFNLILPFTKTLLNQYFTYNNSIPYLMRFWVYVTEKCQRINTSAEEIKSVVLNIVEMYITAHLEFVEMMVNDREDDPLNAIEVVQEELECVGKMIRVQLAEGVTSLCKRWDAMYKEYTNDSRTLSTMRMTGNIDPQLQYRITLNECKLSWLIHIMGQILIGQKFTTTQIEYEEELHDAEYCKRVFGLSHTIAYRTTSENSPKVDPRLELALLSFFRSFRETFSAMATIASTEGLSGSAMISGVQQTAYNLFFERLAIGDFTSVMNAIVEKICSNLRFWGNDVGVVSTSLKLFLEMSKGYQGSRMLLQLESIDFMLQNHTEATFRFLAIPDLLPFRTLYYSTLTRLILMDNIPGRLEMFVMPFADMLDRMNNMSFSSPQVVVDCMKMYKDLRGVMMSCNNSRSYNIVYEALGQKAFQFMEKTLQCYPQNDLLIATMLKCLLAFVDNQEPRVDNGKTSTNGITLFKSSSTILINTVNVISQYNANLNTAPESIYRNIRLVLEVFNRSLTGKYVPFGVFLLYNDNCLLTSLEMCMKMALTIPQEQIEKRQKLEKAIFSFIDILFTDHIETLSQINSSSFISIIQAVVRGLESYEGETVKRCADSIDRFATYFYLNQSRTTPTMTRLNSILQETPTLWKELFDKIMGLLLYKNSVDILSRPIHSVFLVDKSVADYFYEKLSATQTPEVVEKLKNAMVELTTNLDQTLEPIIRDQFCERCRKFKEVSRFLIL